MSDRVRTFCFFILGVGMKVKSGVAVTGGSGLQPRQHIGVAACCVMLEAIGICEQKNQFGKSLKQGVVVFSPIFGKNA